MPSLLELGAKQRRLRGATWLVEAGAVLAAALVALALPSRLVDDAVTLEAVRALGSATSPSGVLRLSIEPADLVEPGCSDRLAASLASGGARAVVLWSAVADVCPMPKANANDAGTPVVVRAPRSTALFTRSGSGHVRGWMPDEAVRSALGIHGAEWTLAPRIEAIPGAHAADLVAGRVPPSVMSDRVVVVTLDTDDRTAAENDEVTAAIAAVLLDQRATYVPRAIAMLLGAFIVAAIALAKRRKGTRGLAVVAGAAAVLLGLAEVGLVASRAGLLLPLGTLLSAAVVGTTVLVVRDVLRRRTLLQRTRHAVTSAVTRPTLFDAPDPEFFGSIAVAARRVVPCEILLVGEVARATGRLRFWGPDSLCDTLVAGGSRDPFAPPFCKASGETTPHVASDLFVARDMDAVVVPLVSLGDVEGCLLLGGEQAVTILVEDPSRIEQLAADAAAWLRVRRLRHPRGVSSDPLLTGAAALVDDVDVLGRTLREAPVPMLQADATGRVTRMAPSMAVTLAAAGLSLPANADGPLAADALTIDDAIAALTEAGTAKVAALLGEALASRDGVEVAAPRAPIGHALRITTVRREVDQVSAVVGWSLALVNVRSADAHDAAGAPTTPRAKVASLSEIRSLVVHPAWEAVLTAVESATAGSKVGVRLGSGQITSHVISQRATLFPALAAFLTEAAKQSPASDSPVVSLRERARWVDVVLLDLHLGLTRAAIERVLDAPGAAPPELESLGELVTAVAQSQGTVRVRGKGWNAQLVISLLRARTAAPMSLPPRASNSNVVEAKGRKRKSG